MLNPQTPCKLRDTIYIFLTFLFLKLVLQIPLDLESGKYFLLLLDPPLSQVKIMAPTSKPLTWFITGCSSGLGAALAVHALRSGHKVIATARTPSKAASYDEITSLGGHWVTLDVTSPDAGSVLDSKIKTYGDVDVLVNNAGYSIIGAIEDIRYDLFRFPTKSYTMMLMLLEQR